jgi:hypothetical protein
MVTATRTNTRNQAKQHCTNTSITTPLIPTGSYCLLASRGVVRLLTHGDMRRMRVQGRVVGVRGIMRDNMGIRRGRVSRFF